LIIGTGGRRIAVAGGSCFVFTSLHLSTSISGGVDRAVQCKEVEPEVKTLSSSDTYILAQYSYWGLVRKLFWRSAEIVVHLSPALAWYVLHCLPLGSLVISRMRLHAMLVQCLAQCGPVGIKWGQWASTRYDLFEEDFCMALGTLTNMAPAHDLAHTRTAIEESFGAPVETFFSEFNDECLASGSIGQVHVAKLLRDGSTVAVKVQHPNLTERLALDMTLLRQLSKLAARFAPDLRIGETADQFAANFEAQLDFRDEAKNLQRFTHNFSSSFWSAMVSFPQPVEGLISHDVLVESFEEGESVAKYLERSGERTATDWRQDSDGRWYAADGDGQGTVRYMGEANKGDLRSNIALVGVQAYFKMLIWDNYIHADLHPGNVLIRTQTAGWWPRLQRWLVLGDGSPDVVHIVFLDAGLAASFNERIFDSAKGFFDAIVATDGPRIGRNILGLAETQPFVDARPCGRDAFILEVAEKCAAQKAEFDRGEGRPGDNIRAYMDSVRGHRVVLDPSVMVALMSILVLEGWQHRLDPAVSIFFCLQSAVGKGAFGYVHKAAELAEEVRSFFSSAPKEVRASGLNQ